MGAKPHINLQLPQSNGTPGTSRIGEAKGEAVALQLFLPFGVANGTRVGADVKGDGRDTGMQRSEMRICSQRRSVPLIDA